MPWEAKHYTDLAREFDYQILFLNFEPRKFDSHLKSAKAKIPKGRNRKRTLTEMVENYIF
jgi:hypothetical protein